MAESGSEEGDQSDSEQRSHYADDQGRAPRVGNWSRRCHMTGSVQFRGWRYGRCRNRCKLRNGTRAHDSDRDAVATSCQSVGEVAARWEPVVRLLGHCRGQRGVHSPAVVAHPTDGWRRGTKVVADDDRGVGIGEGGQRR